jgi:hypothetical protein
MQWTILTTNNNVNDAVATHKLQTETALYSIPLGAQRYYTEWVNFHAPSSIYGYGTSCGFVGNVSTCTLPTPVSNSSTTIEDYVVFSVTVPNGTAVMVWYTSPQGNLTLNCSGTVGAPLVVGCILEPNAPGVITTGPYSNLVVQVPTPGNYSIHLLSERCSYSSYCSATTATGTVTLAVSTITYSRPYHTAGLATVIIAGVSIAVAIVFLTITGYHIVEDRRKRSGPRPPPAVHTSEGVD